MNGNEQHYAAVARAIAFIRTNATQQPELAEVAAAAGLSEYRRLPHTLPPRDPRRWQLQQLSLGRRAQAGAAGVGAGPAPTVTFLILLFGTGFDWLFRDEAIGWHTLAGGAVVISVTALAN